MNKICKKNNIREADVEKFGRQSIETNYKKRIYT